MGRSRAVRNGWPIAWGQLSATISPVYLAGAMLGTGKMDAVMTVGGVGGVALSGAMLGAGYMTGTMTVGSVGPVALSGAMLGAGYMTGTMTVGSAGGATFTDNFNRADESLGASPNWTRVDGQASALTVSSNQLASATTAETTYLSPDLGSANHYVEATLMLVGANGPFMLARATNLNNWVGVRNSASAYQVFKRVAGTLTQIGISTGAPAVGDRMRLEVSGDVVNMFINGAAAISGNANGVALNGDLAGVTRQGVIARTSVRNPWIDDFKAGNL